MKAIIIANGTIKNSEILRQEINPTDTIICSDGGVKYVFEEGIIPHYIIGDLDSAPMQIIDFFKMKNVEFKKFDAKKDETDMELAINFAIGLGVEEILILGGIGTRMDHTITNINLLMKSLNANVKTTIKDDNNEISLIDDSIEILGEKGTLISLIPLSSQVLGVTTNGLEYPLKNAKMQIGNSLGVSNVMEEEKAIIKIEKGYLLVIKARD